VVPFDLSVLRRELKPFRLHWFSRLRSTSDHAAVLRKRDELFAPAVVLTGHQLAGRGRGSNTWWSGRGSLTATFVLPANEHLAAHHVPLLAGLAVRSAAVELAGTQDILLKWPNDLLCDGRKLAGLLCERIHGADLIGVGLNVDIDPADVPPKLRSRVTGLNLISNRPADLTASLIAVARHLHRRLANRDEQRFSAALKEYDRHHALIGRQVTVTTGDETVAGICEGLDGAGRLLVRDKRTTHQLIAGHVAMIE
jgi:BirA family biotin operon repressor/biotin-[acetyl-CoA-carboxylase] ligase